MSTGGLIQPERSPCKWMSWRRSLMLALRYPSRRIMDWRVKCINSSSHHLREIWTERMQSESYATSDGLNEKTEQSNWGGTTSSPDWFSLINQSSTITFWGSQSTPSLSKHLNFWRWKMSGIPFRPDDFERTITSCFIFVLGDKWGEPSDFSQR